MLRRGRKSAAQTPAPAKDRIYGSKTNPKGSASSEKSAKAITLSDKIIFSLRNKLKEFKEKHPTKKNITLADLKAVYRRGLGAYSSTHRPTITGGVPNTRNAWAMARVNKFLLKAGGTKVKAAYVQDDDLMKYANGGEIENDGFDAERYMFDATPQHAKDYGLDAEKPLYILDLTKEQQIKEILEYASKNGNDVIFGHIVPEEDQDVESIKSMLIKSGFKTCEGNDDFYKLMEKEIKLPDLNLSYDSLKRTLNMQGYEIEPMKKQEVGKLAKGMSVQQIAQHHNTTVEKIQEQLDKGTKVEMEHTDNQDIARAIALDHVYESPVYYDKLATIEEEFKDGGVVVGKRHSEYDENGSGEKFLVESTGQVVELEGGEGVLCEESMSSDKKFNFDGKSMTGREIASYLNHKYGGVEFAKGGQVDKKIDKIIADKHVCGCKHQYYHGGELPTAVVKNLKGGEAVVTVKSMESQDKYYFNGRSMTPRQIFSSINLASGGKKFEDGGTIDLKSIRMETETQLAKMMYYVSTLNGLIPSSKKEMLWQSIKDKFSEVFYADTDDENNEIFSNDVKAEEHVWMFDRYSPYASTLSWADAKSLFLRKLTKEEKEIITIEYDVRNISEAFGLMWQKKILVKLN